MTDTTFVNQDSNTPIVASWLNDVNIAIYRVLGAAGVSPTTAAQALTNLSAWSKAELAATALTPTPVQGAGYIGYRNPYGDTGTTVQVREQNVLYASDFGVGTNITIDESTHILAAVTAAAAVGATLEFPAGGFTILTPIVYAGTGNTALTIRGQGMGNTIFYAGGAAAAGNFETIFKFTGMNYLTIEDCTFDGQNTLTTPSTTSLVGIATSSNVTVRHCAFINTYRLGLAVNAGSNYNIHNNVFTKTGTAEGTYHNEAFLASTAAGTIVRSFFTDNICNGWATEFSGSEWQITGNIIHSFGYGGGITIEDDVNTTRVLIDSNIIYGGTGIDENLTQPAGVECWAPYSMISNNFCYANSNAGIAFGGLSTVVTGNHCMSNGTYNNTGSGIGALINGAGISPDYSVVTGNVLIDPTGTYQRHGYSEQVGGTYVGMVVADNVANGNFTAEYSFSTASTLGAFRGSNYEAATTYDYGPIAAGVTVAAPTITVPGAALGDYCEISCSLDTAQLRLTGYVYAANSVQVLATNTTAATSIDLGSATIYARVTQRRP